jgi:hypothetical protein
LNVDVTVVDQSQTSHHLSVASGQFASKTLFRRAEKRVSGLNSPWRNSICIRAALHPAWLRCSFLKYSPVFSVVAPCHPGASPLSVRRWTCATGRYVRQTGRGDPHPHGEVAGLRRVFRATLTPCSKGFRHEPARADQGSQPSAISCQPAAPPWWDDRLERQSHRRPGATMNLHLGVTPQATRTAKHPSTQKGVFSCP